MTYVEKLFAKMEQMGVRLGGVTLGDSPGTSENVARELLKALEELEAGNCEPAYCYDSPALLSEVGMDEEDRLANPYLFRERYAAAAERRGKAIQREHDSYNVAHDISDLF